MKKLFARLVWLIVLYLPGGGLILSFVHRKAIMNWCRKQLGLTGVDEHARITTLVSQ